MKRLFFVSTGRCGTTRIAEILDQHLPYNFSVHHQTNLSRHINVLGNFLYHFQFGRLLVNLLYQKIMKQNYPIGNVAISTDPLLSMVLPQNVVESSDTVIVHIIRDDKDFATSMYRYTRKRTKSFFAHNFIPLWQPYLWPLENLFSNSIIDKYIIIHRKKNAFFETMYSKNPNYIKITMAQIFSQSVLEHLINKYWSVDISISTEMLCKKTNQSNT